MIKKIITFLLVVFMSVDCFATESVEHYLKGLLYGRSGNLRSAIEEYQKTIALDPKSVILHKELAELYLRLGDMNKARAELKDAMVLAPDNLEVLLLWANVSQMLEQGQQAIDTYQKILSLDKENQEALLYLGNLYLQTEIMSRR